MTQNRRKILAPRAAMIVITTFLGSKGIRVLLDGVMETLEVIDSQKVD
jgi:hypothetical protein